MNNIIPLLAFKDNYIWTWIDEPTQTAWVVDPGEAKPVLDYLAKMKVNLAGILLTHHHHDHSGGIKELKSHWPKATVFGSHKSAIQEITHPVKEGDTIVCGSAEFKVLEIPGHTLDHTAFYNSTTLFSGDTLFSAGCGRVFEGTPAQMVQSLQKLLQLSESTKLYCGHEYTLANLNFAALVEPDNADIMAKTHETVLLRSENKPSLPSVMRDEKLFNPFLRTDKNTVIQAVEKHVNKKLNNSIEVFAALREWKNNL